LTRDPTRPSTISLGDALERAEEYAAASALYVESETFWNPQTRAQIVATDRYTLEPAEPVADGLRPVLSVQDVQQVVHNARAQVGQATSGQLVEALRYDTLRDAFITFPRREPRG
jgi:hypothetical protein